MLNTMNNYINFPMINHFYRKEWELINAKILVLIEKIKKVCVVHISTLKQSLNQGLVLQKV